MYKCVYVYGLAVINRPDRLLSCDTKRTGEEDGFHDFSTLHSYTLEDLLTF